MNSANLSVVLVAVLITLSASTLVFILLRELACRYWKVNQRIALLQEQNQLLKEIRDGVRRMGQPVSERKTVELPHGLEVPADP